MRPADGTDAAQQVKDEAVEEPRPLKVRTFLQHPPVWILESQAWHDAGPTDRWAMVVICSRCDRRVKGDSDLMPCFGGQSLAREIGVGLRTWRKIARRLVARGWVVKMARGGIPGVADTFGVPGTFGSLDGRRVSDRDKPRRFELTPRRVNGVPPTGAWRASERVQKVHPTNPSLPNHVPPLSEQHGKREEDIASLSEEEAAGLRKHLQDVHRDAKADLGGISRRSLEHLLLTYSAADIMATTPSDVACGATTYRTEKASNRQLHYGPGWALHACRQRQLRAAHRQNQAAGYREKVSAVHDKDEAYLRERRNEHEAWEKLPDDERERRIANVQASGDIGTKRRKGAEQIAAAQYAVELKASIARP